ncbi:MAG: hypothetical protein RL199_487 [Pseudomonadota bacterium]|jgi:hypothetical protein
MTPAPMNTEASGLCIAALRAGRALTIVNLSPSLSPFVRVGDALTLDPSEQVRLGALVAVERAGRIVFHRLVRREAGRIVLQGDANPFRDAPDEIEAVLGVVTRQTTRSGRTLDHRRGRRRVPGAAPGLRDQKA